MKLRSGFNTISSEKNLVMRKARKNLLCGQMLSKIIILAVVNFYCLNRIKGRSIPYFHRLS